MGRPSRYSPEVRERAVRLVIEHESQYASPWAGALSVAGKIGCSPETLRNWVRQAERRGGFSGAQQLLGSPLGPQELALGIAGRADAAELAGEGDEEKVAALTTALRDYRM